MSEFKIKAIAIDDEQHCLDTLIYELERHCPQVQIINQITDPVLAKTTLENAEVDLVFLDVNLQSTTGIKLLEELMPVDFEVIFVTAYDEYALKAFDLSAAHYLMKPVNGIKLKKAIEKVERLISKEQPKEDLELILKNIQEELNKSEKIALNVQDGIEFIDPTEIIYIEGDSNYSSIFLQDGKKIVVSKTLKYLEESILSSSFFRIHKSYIINLNKMKKFVKTDGGYVIMENDDTVPVSRQKKNILNQIFKS